MLLDSRRRYNLKYFKEVIIIGLWIYGHCGIIGTNIFLIARISAKCQRGLNLTMHRAKPT
jgi:hypothetical protein